MTSTNQTLLPKSTDVVFSSTAEPDVIYSISVNTGTSTSISKYSSTNTSGNSSSLSTELNHKICSENLIREELLWSHIGIQLAVPEWEAILTIVVLSVIIVMTIIGNILVILSVFTYKPLRIVQNFFIVSLAVADLTVALLVLPFNVAYSILGRWEFGIHLCKMWLTCDVMCCTSSILNLCAIALDRYWAITDPINYAQKRTVGRVLLLITGVWLLSLLISSPPLVGWNDWPVEFTSATPCELTSNRGYVIYSSLGSFFIPLAIMTIVYIEIYIATRRRLRERSKASKINTITIKSSDGANIAENGVGISTKGHNLSMLCANIFCCGKASSQLLTAESVHHDQDSISSETRGNEDVTTSHLQQLKYNVVVVTKRNKNRRTKIKDSIRKGKSQKQHQTNANFAADAIHEEDDGEIMQQPRRSLVTSFKGSNDSNPSISDVNNQKTTPLRNAGISNEECSSLKVTQPQLPTEATYSIVVSPRKKTTGIYQFIEEKQKISLSKERRAARTLGVIMGVFVICWLPFFLMYVILPFCESCCPSSKFKNFITWLGYINSGLNPVIYTIFNMDYRRAFKRLLGFD